jgi:hypothetical protein
MARDIQLYNDVYKSQIVTAAGRGVGLRMQKTASGYGRHLRICRMVSCEEPTTAVFHLGG